MPTGTPRRATPLQVQRHGHIAQVIRTLMEQRRWQIADLHNALGLSRKHTAGYGWLRAVSAPGPANRRKLAALAGVPEDELEPREPEAGPSSGTPAGVPERAQALVVRQATKPLSTARPGASGGASGKASFTFTLDASAGPVTVQVTLGQRDRLK